MATGESLLAAGSILAVMILPFVASISAEALGAVPGDVWPKGRAGLMAAVVLAAGHAFGSAAPVLLTASVVIARSGLDLSSPVMTLPSHLYYLVSEASSLEQAYATALILVGLLLTANFSVMLIRSRQERWSSR